VNYHQRIICPGDLDTDAAYHLVWFIYRRKYQDRLPRYLSPEDLVQEGVLRLLEMAGHSRFREKGFQFYLALNAMKGFIVRQRRLRGVIGGTTSGDEETLRQDAWSSWQAGWQAKLEEAQGRVRARTCTCSSTKLVRKIYDGGEAANQARPGRQSDLRSLNASKMGDLALGVEAMGNSGDAMVCQGQAIRLQAQDRPLLIKRLSLN